MKFWNYFFTDEEEKQEDDNKFNREKNILKKQCYRLHDNSYGVYRGKKVFESQETVGETSTMPHEDFKYFRFFLHFFEVANGCGAKDGIIIF